MNHKELLNHCKEYPLLKPEDAFKFLFQSIFGCEHMISSPEFVINNIKEESKTATKHNNIIEPLDGNYCRVNLDILHQGLSPETLGKLFFMSARKEKGNINDLKSNLLLLSELVQSKKLPFSQEEFSKALGIWEEKNYPPISHSDTFRSNYRPAYRVIASEYIPFLPLFAKIDSLLKKGCVNLAIEGGSASGKSTLGNILESIYDCNLFHMDDFFLQPHQRTQERLNQAGGNVDHERFLSQVLLPLSKGQMINYQRFDCASMTLQPPKPIKPKNLNIVEGAYSMHPDLKNHYNLSVFLDISPKLQRERILKRNPEMADRFFNEWIPFEHKYFDAFGIKNNCDLIIRTE